MKKDQTKRKRKLIFARLSIRWNFRRQDLYDACFASANYTKPELVTDTFFSWLGIELPEFAYSIKRLEVYADKGTEEEHKFITLEALGEEVE